MAPISGYWFLLWIQVASKLTTAFPDGAPKLIACNEGRPNHAINAMRVDELPGSIDTNASTVGMGGIIAVTVRFPLVRGLVLHAVDPRDGQLKGQFIEWARLEYQPLACRLDNDTMTHQAPTVKSNSVFYWRAPNENTVVQFRATIVEDFNNFWYNVNSNRVQVNAARMAFAFPFPFQSFNASRTYSIDPAWPLGIQITVAILAFLAVLLAVLKAAKVF